jgi:parallel beta-helix repeat protein
MIKNRLKFRSLIILLAIAGFSCEKDDGIDNIEDINSDYCFDITEDDLYAEMPINFNASCSSPSSYYVWDFGDGDSSTGMEVNHTYDVEGKYNVSLSVGNHPDSLITIEKTLDILASPFIKHSGYIDEDEIWEEGMHLITGKVTIRNGSLKIMPGAEVYFSQNKSLVIGHENGKDNALFQAIGTNEKPIKFVPANNSETPGSWGVILFRPQASNDCSMEYCHVSYGGQIGSTDFWLDDNRSSFGMIYIDETNVAFNNCSFIGSKKYGIRLTKNARFSSFQNNSFSENLQNPIYMYASFAHTIGNTSRFEGDKSIVLKGSTYLRFANDVTWYQQDVPYYIDGGIGLYDDINLTIEAGTVIELDSENMMNSGYIETKKGSITAIGTESEPILFTSARETKNRGDWTGIMISSNSTLEHCIIEYAGSRHSVSSYERALYISGEGITVKNCTIKESSRFGLFMKASNAIISNNTIQNCDDYGVYVNIEQYHLIDESNTLENTGGYYLTSNGRLYEDYTIVKRSYPYIMDGLSVYTDATLTIEPGTHIQFRSKGGISMGYSFVGTNYSGNLKAKGTEEDPITFSLYEKDQEAGNKNWGGIYFTEGSSTSIMEHCILEGGGYNVDGNGNEYPNIGVIHCNKTQGFPGIINCTISNSATYAITLEQASITESNNTFNNNASGNIYEY